jgi:hypothetical protein
MVVHLPNNSTSRLKGKVRRALKTSLGMGMGTPLKKLKNGMGIEITEYDDNYLRFILSFIE